MSSAVDIELSEQPAEETHLSVSAGVHTCSRCCGLGAITALRLCPGDVLPCTAHELYS